MTIRTRPLSGTVHATDIVLCIWEAESLIKAVSSASRSLLILGHIKLVSFDLVELCVLVVTRTFDTFWCFIKIPNFWPLRVSSSAMTDLYMTNPSMRVVCLMFQKKSEFSIFDSYDPIRRSRQERLIHQSLTNPSMTKTLVGFENSDLFFKSRPWWRFRSWRKPS